MRTSLALLVLVLILNACDSQHSSSADTSVPPASQTTIGGSTETIPRGRVAARFVERTQYDIGGGEVIRGAFDWTRRAGWAFDHQIGNSNLDVRIIQVGRRCYRRQAGGPWEKFLASDTKGLELFGDPHGGLCDPLLLASPVGWQAFVAKIADGWQAVGRDLIGGVETTHYRGNFDVGAVKGPVDLWVDRDGLTRRFRQKGEGFTTVREYSNFGLAVHVRVPRK